MFLRKWTSDNGIYSTFLLNYSLNKNEKHVLFQILKVIFLNIEVLHTNYFINPGIYCIVFLAVGSQSVLFLQESLLLFAMHI